MDALALLCTLHADGPSTLKELRMRGCSDLGAFSRLSASDLARHLDVEPAVARRLIREAKLLAERIGLEALEAEEAPPVSHARPEPAAFDRPPIASEPEPSADSGRGLDAKDLEFVARIVGEPAGKPSGMPTEASINEDVPAEVVTPPEPVNAEPVIVAEAADTVEQAGSIEVAAEAAADAVVSAESTEEVAEPLAVVIPDVIPDVILEVAEESVHEDLPGLLRVGALPGLDEPMLEDLHAAGFTTFAELAAAESLSLTRNLGVTFAQARRLRFLARRAAESTPSVRQPSVKAEVAVAGSVAESLAEPLPERAVEVPIPAAAAVEALPSSPVAPELLPTVTIPSPASVASIDKSRSVPGSAPSIREAEPVAELLAESLPEPAAEPIVQAAREVPSVDAKKAFWEPRAFHDEAPTPEEQGVKVDPNEIEARPRFGEQFARAAAAGKLKRGKAESGRTVLGWNFEIPRPEEESLPLASVQSGAVEVPAAAAVPASSGTGQAESAGSCDSDREAAGPFA